MGYLYLFSPLWLGTGQMPAAGGGPNVLDSPLHGLSIATFKRHLAVPLHRCCHRQKSCVAEARDVSPPRRRAATNWANESQPRRSRALGRGRRGRASHLYLTVSAASKNVVSLNIGDGDVFRRRRQCRERGRHFYTARRLQRVVHI